MLLYTHSKICTDVIQWIDALWGCVQEQALHTSCIPCWMGLM